MYVLYSFTQDHRSADMPQAETPLITLTPLTTVLLGVAAMLIISALYLLA